MPSITAPRNFSVLWIFIALICFSGSRFSQIQASSVFSRRSRDSGTVLTTDPR